MIELDGYRILRSIGTGGAGSVFAAEEIASGRVVAVKALRIDRDDAESRARFEREASAASAVEHPAIVPVLATGALADGRPYLVLPLLEGRSLREELDARGTLPEREAWEIVRQVAEALDAAHRSDVVHRDVKPENVFLEGPSGRVRILDFGIAKRIDDAALTKLTGTGAPLGTPAYMAPEQWWAAPVDGQTDQYSLGAVLFELLAGHPPFAASSFAELLQKHLHEAPPALAGELDAVVRRMLAKSKDERFASMAEVVREGDRVLGRDALPAPPPRRAWPVVATTAAAGAALLVGVGYAGAARRDVVAWLVGGGPVFQVVIALITSVALLAVVRGVRGVFWLALAPAFVGLVMTQVGWSVVKAATRHAPPLDRLDVLHMGIFEINMLRFLGFGLAATVLVAHAALTARTRPRAPDLDRVALAAACLLAGLAWALSAPSVFLVAAVLAAPALAARRPPPARTEPAGGLDRAIAVVVAAGLATAVAFARIEAREAAAWTTEATRLERIHEIVDAARERTTSTVLVGLVLVAVVVLEVLRARRGAREPGAWRRLRVLVGAVAVAVLADLWLHVELAEARAGVRHDLAPQFALFAALEPPRAPGRIRGRPRRATAVQVSRTMVAVDGVPVAPIAALMSPPGEAHVGAEIDRALATAAASGESTTLVSLMVDREVSFAVVRRLLDRARASGATDAEVLLTRGAPGHVPDGAPGEASLVKATDFVALPVVVGDDGAEPGDDQTFGEVVPALVLSAGHLRSDVLSRGQ